MTTHPGTVGEAPARVDHFLSTSDRWAVRYFDPADLHRVDRRLFGT